MDSLNVVKDELLDKAHQLEVSMIRFIRHQSLLEKKADISLSDLFNIDDLKEIMIPFHESTGLGVALFDENHELLASEGWQKICTNFHQKHPEAHHSCLESENYFKKHFKPNQAISHKCKNGLWDIAYPIFLDDNLIGSIVFGQFFYADEKIDKTFFIGQAEKFNFDQDAYITELKTVPIMNRGQIESYVKLFVKIIEKTASLGEL